MTQKELIEWHQLIRRQSYAGKLESYEETRLFQLNHRVIEQAHKIHNDHMTDNS